MSATTATVTALRTPHIEVALVALGQLHRAEDAWIRGEPLQWAAYWRGFAEGVARADELDDLVELRALARQVRADRGAARARIQALARGDVVPEYRPIRTGRFWPGRHCSPDLTFEQVCALNADDADAELGLR